ncbi:hypothetical protein GCM10023082_38420 [Streptomyces tremellae]|uniref:Uncharacterized protein n=1 Tax=Streptomyces tremellae TaxID=1124239 RepID=A0ABP7FE17_9ACTN
MPPSAAGLGTVSATTTLPFGSLLKPPPAMILPLPPRDPVSIRDAQLHLNTIGRRPLEGQRPIMV